MDKKSFFILSAVFVCMIVYFSNNVLLKIPNFIIIISDIIIFLFCIYGVRLIQSKNHDIASISNLMLICGLYFFSYQLIITIVGGISMTDLFSIILMTFPFLCPCIYHNIEYSKVKTQRALNIIKVSYIIVSVFFIYSRLFLSINNGLNYEKLVSYTNSIYFILLFLPFLELFKRSWPYYIIMFVCIVISGKRTPFIAFSLAMLVVYFALLAKNHKIRNTILSFMLLLASFYLYNYISSIFDVVLLGKFGNLQEDEGGGRVEIYQLFYDKLANAPIFEFIFGHGGINSTAKASVLQISAHNDFIEVLYDFGFVGLIFLLTILVKLLHLLIKTFKKNSRYSVSFAMSLCVFIVSISFSNVIFIRYFIMLAIFWSYIFEEINYEEKYTNYCAK